MASDLRDKLSHHVGGPVIGEQRAARQARQSTMPLHFSERRLLLALGDILMLNAALGVSLLFHGSLARFTIAPAHYLEWAGLLTLVWLVVGYLLGLYDLGSVADSIASVGPACFAALVTWFVYLLSPVLTPPFPDDRLRLLILPAAAVVGIGGWRIAYAKMMAQPGFNRRVLIVGAGPAAMVLTRTIAQFNWRNRPSASMGYEVIGFVEDAPSQSADRIDDLPVLGAYPDLPGVIDRCQPDEIVIATQRWREAEDHLLRSVVAAQERGIRITTMTMLYEQLTGRLALEQVGQRFDIVLPLRHAANLRLYLALRRLAELLVSLVGCLVVLAAIPFVWLANRVSSPGPLFLFQERVGQGGRLFKIVKFRSMIVDAEQYTGPIWATENDPRITKVGRWLRRTRLDETPQFWNVLRGDMSLIGPRPERPQFVAQLAETMPFYRVRHCVRPGLTGWAQVKYRYASSVDDSLIKLQYDLYYVKHGSPMLDLLIVLRTAQIILGLKGQ
jgi:exopolysaccharide biosynthesis polyprenyl glycosylphosphotransferase